MLSDQQRVNGNVASKSTKKRASLDSQVKQAVVNQQVLRSIIDNPESRDLDRVNAVRAWDVMSDRLRILRGKPLPGQLQPDRVPKRRSSRRVIGLATPEQVAAQVASEGAA